MFAYSDNGLASRSVDGPSDILPGEVFFASAPTPAQLEAAFSGYTAAVALATGITVGKATYANLIAGGMTITSTGTPALNATYPTDADQQALYTAVQAAILTNAALFPGYLYNAAGAQVTMTAAQGTAIIIAILAFIAAANNALQAAKNGGTPSWPIPTATIA
jgi:hypothetical protein